MTLNEYQTLAARTIATDDTNDMRMHALLGLASECSELMGAVYVEDDRGHIIKEAGDVAWMCAELCTACGWHLHDMAAPLEDPFIESRFSALYLNMSAGELLGIYQKVYQGHQLNVTDVWLRLNEIFDYLRVLAEYIGGSLDEILQTNIEKLKKRYPDGFNPDRSLHRADGDV